MPAEKTIRRLITESPAFACYLLAVALIPFRWLSPLGGLQEHAQLTDVLVAAAAVLWLIERIWDRDLLRAYRPWQIPLALYLAVGAVAQLAAPPEFRGAWFGGSWKTVLLMTELAVLAVITADFASDPPRRRLIMRVILASALATVALGVLGLILFYADIPNAFLGGYGELVGSRSYVRIRAGFESAPLLASFCIFASGIAASRDAGLAPKLRIPAQFGLGLLCLTTFSRGFIGFLLAVAIRWSAALRGTRRTVVALTAATACVGIIAALSVGSLKLDPAHPTSASYAIPGADNARSENFTSSLRTLGEHPLFGVGPGALPGIHPSGSPWRAHFTPLNVAATLGIPGLLALIAMFWLLWRSRVRPTDVALWSALIGMALDGLANDIDHYRHLWVLIGLLGAQASGFGRADPLRQEELAESRVGD